MLEDGSAFYCSISPYELKNGWGNNIAILQEYRFGKKEDKIGQFTCKLYMTKEENWYDISEINIFLRHLLWRI